MITPVARSRHPASVACNRFPNKSRPCSLPSRNIQIMSGNELDVEDEFESVDVLKAYLVLFSYNL